MLTGSQRSVLSKDLTLLSTDFYLTKLNTSEKMHSISEAKIENFIIKSAIRKQLKRGHSIPDLAIHKKASAQETSLNEINAKSLRTGKI
jgi:hypothetical protein